MAAKILSSARGDSPELVPYGDDVEVCARHPYFAKSNCAECGLEQRQRAASWEGIEMMPLAPAVESPEFPIDVFSDSLRQFVVDYAWAFNAPRDFLGTGIIAAAAGAIGNAVRLKITLTHQQPAIIFAAMIGAPGSAKSPVMKELSKPFDRIQIEHNRKYRDELESAGKQDKKPKLGVVIGRNITVETLALMLNDNPRGIFLPIDELSGLFTGLNQYKGGKGNDRQFYLAAWSQETIDIKRKSDLANGNMPLFVANPCISIFGGIQPDLVASIRGEHRPGQAGTGDGGIDRFLFCWPETMPAIGEEWRDVEEKVQAVWPAIVDKLVQLNSADYADTSIVEMRLNAGARKAYEKITQKDADEINAEGFPDHLRGPWQKLRAYLARLSLVVHSLRWACDDDVNLRVLDAESVSRAGQLVDYFKGNARKVYAEIDADDRIADARHLVRWIENSRLKQFTKKEAFEALRRSFTTVELLEEPLRLIEKHGIIRLKPTPKDGPGRKPSPTYEVNPLLENCPQNPQNSNPPKLKVRA